MKFKILFLSLWTIQFAEASFIGGIWNNNIELTQDYACVDLDGIPIAKESDLAAKCCDVGQQPSICKVGFYRIGMDAVTNTNGGSSLAYNTLNLASGLTGNSMNPTTPSPSLSGNNGFSSPTSESVASVAGSGGTGYGSGSASSAGNDSGNNGEGNGSGSGANGGGAAGSGLTLGSAGGTSGLKSGDGDASGDRANGGGYVKSGGNGKSGSGAGGLGGFGGFGAFGGAGGANGGGVGAGGASELAFGSGAGDVAGGANGEGDDGDGRGTAEDPSDYFSRIDKSANIFKIVSARYLKKKSLWMIPQKLPEEKKI